MPVAVQHAMFECRVPAVQVIPTPFFLHRSSAAMTVWYDDEQARIAPITITVRTTEWVLLRRVLL